MGNLLQYADKSKTIDNKIAEIISDINYDYKHGSIRTETEYYYRIKNMINNMYKTLTKPMFEYRPAVSVPISSDYNSMISEAYSDMSYIIEDCKSLNEMIESSFTDAQLSRDMMSAEIEYLTKKVQVIGQSINKYESNGTIVFTELFENNDYTYNLSDDNACTVDTTNGILTLGRNVYRKVDITSIEIDKDFSNGFPGNTHCVNTLNSEIHFMGQDGLHIDPYFMYDGNNDTWFEFELFKIDDTTRKECNSYGFDYNEGVSWVNNNDYLKLKLTIKLDNQSICGVMNIVPYLSNIKGIEPAIIEHIDIVTSNGVTYKVGTTQALDGRQSYVFPPNAISKIEIYLIQPSSYRCKVGHFYYTNTNALSMSIFQDFEKADIYSRVDNVFKPNVAMLGVKYDPTTQWLNYSDSDIEIPEDEYIKANIFTTPESTADKKSGVEIIDAYRYFIGIREINFFSCTYKDTSEYISKPFTTEDVITSITLSADEYTPGKDPDVLRYYISLDNGSMWHRIYPMQRSYGGISKYYINSDSIENTLMSMKNRFRAQNISIIGEPKSVQLKIEMDRVLDVDNNNYATPIVYSYRLKVTTGGDSIEY